MRPSTPIFVEALEELARSRAASPVRTQVVEGPSLSLRLLAAFERGAGRALMLDERERFEAERSQKRADWEQQDRRTRLAAKAEVRAEKARRLQERQQLKQQQRKRRTG